MGASNKWGFTFAVDTRDFQKLTRAYSDIDSITQKVQSLHGSMGNVVASMADQIVRETSKIKDAVKGVADVIKQAKAALKQGEFLKSQFTNPLARGGSPSGGFMAGGNVDIGKGRGAQQKYFQEQYGVSRYQFQQQTRQHQVERVDYTKADGTKGRRIQPVMDNGRKVPNQPAGGKLTLPGPGSQFLTSQQLFGNVMRLTVTHPIVLAIDKVAKAIHDRPVGRGGGSSVPPVNGASRKQFQQAIVVDEFGDQKVAGSPAQSPTPPPLKTPNASKLATQLKSKPIVIEAIAPKAREQLSARGQVYASLAQRTPAEFGQYRSNPKEFSQATLSAGPLAGMPKAIEAIFKQIQSSSEGVHDSFVKLMDVASELNKPGRLDQLTKAAEGTGKNRSGKINQEDLVKLLSDTIIRRLDAQATAGARLTSAINANPGMASESMVTQRNRTSQSFGKIKNQEDFSDLISDSGTVPVFGSNLFNHTAGTAQAAQLSERTTRVGAVRRQDLADPSYTSTDEDKSFIKSVKSDSAKLGFGDDDLASLENKLAILAANIIRKGIEQGIVAEHGKAPTAGQRTAGSYLEQDQGGRFYAGARALGLKEHEADFRSTNRISEYGNKIYDAQLGSKIPTGESPGEISAARGQTQKLLAEIAKNTAGNGGMSAANRSRSVEDHLDEAIGTGSMKRQSTFADRFRNAIGRTATYGGSAGLIYGGVNTLRNGLESATGMDQQMTNLRKVVNPAEGDIRKLGVEAKNMGSEFGIANEEVAKTMLTFAQQGKGLPDILKNTRTALMATNVTEMSLTESTEALTVAEKQFGFTAQSSERILDSWVSIQDSAAVKANTLADAIKLSATSARAAGIDFHTLNGMIGAVGESTHESGERIGTSFNHIIGKLKAPKSVEALQQVGIESEDGMGNMKAGQAVLGDLASKWSKLSDAQRQNLAISIAGTEHLNDFYVVMQTWDRALDLSVTSLTAQGSAARKNGIAMESLDKKIDQLRSSYTGLWQDLGNSGALDVLKQVADALRGIIDLTGKMNHVTGGVLGGLVGTLGVAGIGVGGASYIGSHFLPEVASGGFRKPGVAEQVAKTATSEALQGEASAALGMTGAGGGSFFTKGRAASAGLLVASGTLQAMYQRQAPAGTASTKRDFIVGEALPAIGTAAGLVGMIKKAGGVREQGIGRNIAIAAIVAETVGQVYSQYKKSAAGASPAENLNNSADKVKLMGEKYSNANNELQDYIRDQKSGASGEGSDPSHLADMKDMVAALAPELVNFNKAGATTLDEVEKWSEGLSEGGKKLMNQRALLIQSSVEKYIASPETIGLLKKRDDLTALQQSSGNKPLSDRLAIASDLGDVKHELRDNTYGQVMGSAILNGRTTGAINPYSKETIGKYANVAGIDPEAFTAEQLRRGLQGATGGKLIDVQGQLTKEGRKASDVEFYQNSASDSVKSRFGATVATAGKQAEAFGRSNYVFKPNDSFTHGIVLSPDANLNKLLNTLTTSMDRLTARNAAMIQTADSTNRNQGASAFGPTAGTSIDMKTLLRSGQTLQDINRGGIQKIFGPVIDTDSNNLQTRMRQRIGQVMNAGSDGQTVSAKALIASQPQIQEDSDRARVQSQGWVKELIKSGGIGRIGDPENPDGNNPLRHLTESFPQLKDQLTGYTSQIDEARKNKTPESDAKIESISKLMQSLVAGASSIDNNQLREKTNTELTSQLSQGTQFSHSTIATLGTQYNIQRGAGRTSGISDFIKDPDVAKAVDFLKNQLHDTGENLATLKNQLAEYAKKPDAEPAALANLKKQIDETSVAFETQQSNLAGLNKTVEFVEYGFNQLNLRMERVASSANLGGSFGLTGKNQNAFATDVFKKELDRLAVEFSKLDPKDATGQSANIHQSTAVADSILQRQNQDKETDQQRQASVEGLGQSVLSRRLNLSAGINDSGGSAQYIQTVKAQFSEFTERLSAQLAPALKGMSAGKQEDVLRQVSSLLAPMNAQMSQLMRASDPGYQSAYAVASTGEQSAADHVQAMANQGLSLKQVFGQDPSLKYAAQNNPLMAKVLDKLAANEADKEALKYQSLIEKNTGETAKSITDFLNSVRKSQGLGAAEPLGSPTGQGAGSQSSAPAVDQNPFNAQKMKIGSMAMAGTAAVDGKGRIRADGTPAVLHQGEIVLNKGQSNAFLKNHFATGTLPTQMAASLPGEKGSLFKKLFGKAIDTFSNITGVDSGPNVRLTEAGEAGEELVKAGREGFLKSVRKLGLTTEGGQHLLDIANPKVGSGLMPDGSIADALHYNPKAKISADGKFYTAKPSVTIANVPGSKFESTQRKYVTGLTAHELQHELDATAKRSRIAAPATAAGEEFRKLAGMVHNQQLAMHLKDGGVESKVVRNHVLSAYSGLFDSGKSTIQDLLTGTASNGHNVLSEMNAHRTQLATQPGYRLTTDFKKLNDIKSRMNASFWDLLKDGPVGQDKVIERMTPFMKQMAKVTGKYGNVEASSIEQLKSLVKNGIPQVAMKVPEFEAGKWLTAVTKGSSVAGKGIAAGAKAAGTGMLDWVSTIPGALKSLPGQINAGVKQGIAGVSEFAKDSRTRGRLLGRTISNATSGLPGQGRALLGGAGGRIMSTASTVNGYLGAAGTAWSSLTADADLIRQGMQPTTGLMKGISTAGFAVAGAPGRLATLASDVSLDAEAIRRGLNPTTGVMKKLAGVGKGVQARGAGISNLFDPDFLKWHAQGFKQNFGKNVRRLALEAQPAAAVAGEVYTGGKIERAFSGASRGIMGGVKALPGGLKRGYQGLESGLGAISRFHGLANLGLGALALGGQRAADHFGFGDGYKKTGGLAVDLIGEAQAFSTLGSGGGLTGFNLGGRALTGAGRLTSNIGEFIGRVPGLSRAGSAIEAGGEGLGFASKGLTAFSKGAGADIFGGIMAPSAALDVDRLGTNILHATGAISDTTAKRTNETLNAVGTGFERNSGIEFIGSKFSDSWAKSVADADAGEKLLAAQMARNGVDGGWLGSSGAVMRDISAGMAVDAKNMEGSRADAIQSSAMKTPLLYFARDLIQKRMAQTKSDDKGNVAPWVGKALDGNSDPLKARTALIDATEVQLKGILKGYSALGNQFGNDPEFAQTQKDMQDKLSALDAKKQELSSAMAGGNNDVADVFQVAELLGRNAKLVSGDATSGKNKGNKKTGFQDFAKFAFSLPDDLKADALKQGGMAAYRAMFPNGDQSTAESWGAAAAMLPPTATAADLFKGKFKTLAEQQDDKSVRRHLDVAGIDSKAAAGDRAEQLKSGAAVRDFKGDASSISRASDTASNSQSFAASLAQMQTPEAKGYAANREQVSKEADYLKNQLAYSYHTGSNPGEIAAKKQIYDKYFDRLNDDGKNVRGSFNDLMAAGDQTTGLFGKLRPAQQKFWLKQGGMDGKFDPWKLAGIEMPIGTGPIDAQIDSLRGWSEQAKKDSDSWQSVLDANKFNSDAATKLKNDGSIPRIMGVIRKDKSGKTVNQTYLSGYDGPAPTTAAGQQKIVDAAWKKRQAKDSEGEGTLAVLRSGVYNDKFSTNAQFAAELSKNKDLSAALADYNSITASAAQYKAGASASDDRNLATLAGDKSNYLRTSKFSKQTLDSVNALQQAMQRNVEHDAHMKKFATSNAAPAIGVPTESPNDFNKRHGLDKGVYVDVPQFKSGTMAQTSSKAVDGFGRIRKDETPAMLHKGEIVLNRKQSDRFMDSGNHFESGTLGYDPMSMDAIQFGDSMGRSKFGQNSTVHSGQVTVAPTGEMAQMMKQIAALMKENHGKKGVSFREGSVISDRHTG